MFFFFLVTIMWELTQVHIYFYFEAPSFLWHDQSKIKWRKCEEGTYTGVFNCLGPKMDEPLTLARTGHNNLSSSKGAGKK